MIEREMHIAKNSLAFPVVMYGCESWTVKKAERRRIDAFELWCWRRLLRVPWDCKEIQPVHSKGDQSWVFFGRNDAKAETPVLWLPHAKSWLIGKGSDAGRDWGQEEKGMTEDEMAGFHHWLDGQEFGWTLGVGDGKGGLGVAKSRTWLGDWTEQNCATHFCILLRDLIFPQFPALPISVASWNAVLGWPSHRKVVPAGFSSSSAPHCDLQ